MTTLVWTVILLPTMIILWPYSNFVFRQVTVLSEHLQTAGGNAVYTSKTIQNEIIATCGSLIMQQILDSIRETLFFSVIANVANNEQLHFNQICL